MNYEIAQRLKEAGFPQMNKEGLNITTISAGGTHFPTLEEILDAFGETEVQLGKWRDGCYARAYPMGRGRGSEISQAEGKTMIEAASELWIRFNSK